ncbi:MAG: NTP transferase domain-containing protein [Candidatus Omnitrophica bacterium]|nr:NTP transferase domain-containing protein [Candidatus Omnitrophota bacterium]
MGITNFRDLVLRSDATVKSAMKQMSDAGEKNLYVENLSGKILGSISDGDIRRWVLKGGKLSDQIQKVFNKNFIRVSSSYSLENVKQLMLSHRISSIPVINQKQKLENVLLWDEIFKGTQEPKYKSLRVPVVIMAGGKGTRLDPFTRVIPKPLIPVGDKTIIETIISKFCNQGAQEFYISINHKSRMIKAFFEEVERDYDVHFIEETKPLGTIGAARQIISKVKSDVFVTNCDVIIDANYYEVWEYHKAQKNSITIVGSFRHFTIPYGVCYMENGGQLSRMEEKPEFDFIVNTGFYVVDKKSLRLIPSEKNFDMTDLIRAVQENNGRIGIFPIDAKSWTDIGQWDEYRRVLELFGKGS